jgi:hypothetical protein
MQQLQLTLDCGRRVWLSAFAYSDTYSGLLEGLPNAAINGRIIERALVYESWGPRKSHLIPPEVDTRDPRHPALPPALLRAWLWCNDPIDPKFHGSSLVVVWFSNECLEETVTEVVFRAVRGLRWDELAEDFYL